MLVTPAGEDVVGRARVALASVDAVGDAARRRGEPLVGRLRLGVIPTIAPYWLPSLLPRCASCFPRLELVLREDQTARLLAQLDAGQLELALLALPVPGDFTTAAIARENFLVAAPRGAPLLQGTRTLTERDLDDQTVLLLEDGHCLRDQALAVCERGGAVESMRGARDQPADAGPDGRRRPRHHAVARGRRGDARPAARSGRGRRHSAKPQPGRTVGLAWRTSSARLREFKLLADVMQGEAAAMLAKLRR